MTENRKTIIELPELQKALGLKGLPGKLIARFAYRLLELVRKYFNCGARLVCFNVDPDFCNSLDGLIFLRFSDFPENTLRSIVRGLPDVLQERIWLRFYGHKPAEA